MENNHDNNKKSYIELIRAYFCYLIYLFTSISENLRANLKDIFDPANQKKLGSYDMNILVDHFELAIDLSDDVRFVRIIQRNAQHENEGRAWNFLINQLKLKRLKEKNECLLQDLEMFAD
jgi:hypothetical protein